MKKLLVIVGVAFALALTANAAEGAKKHQPLTDEQKSIRKEMLDKYDANKDGKLDKEERAKMTKEDKEKWGKAFGQKHGEKKENKKDDKK